MLSLFLLLAGFLVAGIALAALTLSINDFTDRVDTFCEVVSRRYQSGFYEELEKNAAQKIESLGKSRSH